MIHAYSLTGRIGQHNHQSDGIQAGTLDHGLALTGLTDDDHPIYAILAGRAGGQTQIGGTGAGNNLTLQSTSHATKGSVVLSSIANVTIDEVTGRVGIGATPLEGSLQITQNQTEATNPQAGVQLLANLAPAANVNTPHYGLFMELRTTAAAVTYGNATGLVGVRGSVLFQGTGSVATLVGQKTIVDINNGGACSVAIGNHVVMQKSSGTIDHLFGVGVDSVVGLATNAWAFHSEGGTSRLKTGGASTKGLIIQAAASQSANLQEWQNSAAAVLFQFDSSGFPKWVSGKEQTTVGAAGAASALPANPTKYLQIKDSAGTTLVIPAYAAA